MITRLIIDNFRSIQHLDLPLSSINAIIGPNSSGKSNILRALNLVLGGTYPTIRAFDDNDFFQRSRANHIKIEVHFSAALTINASVHGFRLTHDGADVEYVPLDNAHAALTYPRGQQMRVSNDMRDEVNLLYLDVDRLAQQQVRNSQWVLYGKLLRQISSSISGSHRTQFASDIQTTFNTNISSYITQAETLLKKYVQEQTGLTLSLKLSILDPSMLLKDLRPRIADATNFEVDVEDEGAGVQSSVGVAIARTYADVVQQPLILALEEPELFLHPHGCRHFYSILKDLATKGVQVIYSTHERSFVSIADYDFIRLVRKPTGSTTVHAFSTPVTGFNAIKAASKFDEELNEVFFADKVVLVEGPADKIACRLALDTLTVPIDMRNISIVDAGGITGIKPLAEVLKNFGVTCVALADDDPGNATTLEQQTEIASVVGPTNLLLQKPKLEGLFGRTIKFSKQDALQYLPTWFAANPVPQVYQDLKTLL